MLEEREPRHGFFCLVKDHHVNAADALGLVVLSRIVLVHLLSLYRSMAAPPLAGCWQTKGPHPFWCDLPALYLELQDRASLSH